MTRGRWSAGGGILTREMTLPGVGPAPVAAVTFVGVAPDQRRRGGLRRLMRAQLHGLHEAGGEPLAALWSSQGGIYSRFGYDVAARKAQLAVTSGAAFHSGTDTDRVTLLDRERAWPGMQRLHGRVAPTRVGWISRPRQAWTERLHDPEHRREGASPFRFAIAGAMSDPDGYVVFRTRAGRGDGGLGLTICVHELVAASPAAHAALWRFLLDLDFATEVTHRNVPVDEPLSLLLADPRAAVLTVSDCLWVRLVDLERALTARRYAAECDLAFQVTDEMCPWNAGCWRLQVTDGDPGAMDDMGGDMGAAVSAGWTWAAGSSARVLRAAPLRSRSC